MDEIYRLPVKMYHTGKNTPVFSTYLFSTLSVFGENGPVIYVCTEAIWSAATHEETVISEFTLFAIP